MKGKVYSALLEQIQAHNQIVEYQNKTLDNLIAIYEKDCKLIDNYKRA